MWRLPQAVTPHIKLRTHSSGAFPFIQHQREKSSFGESGLEMGANQGEEVGKCLVDL